MKFAAWIDRLAAAELTLCALAVPVAVASVQLPRLQAPALALFVVLGVLVLVSGALFAIDARVRALDAKIKAGGGLEIRPGKVHKVKRKPAWISERGHLVKVLPENRGGIPRSSDKADGPRVVGMGLRKTS